MGKLVYEPEVISEQELDKLLQELKLRALKVDHYIARSLINDVKSELINEIDNIESGARAESEILSLAMPKARRKTR